MADSTSNLNSDRVQVALATDLDLQIVEVNGQRVVTLAMIDKVHQRPEGTARRNFNVNRDRFVEGEDFEKRSADEIRTRFPGLVSDRATEPVTVLTESGYLMLAKSFTDDLAWEVQRKLVKTYFRKSALGAHFGTATSPRPRIDVSRECRLTLNQNLKLAKMVGLSGNQAALSANRATVAMTGVDTLRLMGVTHMTAPQQEALLTPTDIGKRLRLGSAQVVNLLLCDMGLQTKHRDLKGHAFYEPTDAGLRAGGVMQDTGKKHSTGTPVRQLRWASSVIDHIRGHLEAEAA